MLTLFRGGRKNTCINKSYHLFHPNIPANISPRFIVVVISQRKFTGRELEPQITLIIRLWLLDDKGERVDVLKRRRDVSSLYLPLRARLPRHSDLCHNSRLPGVNYSYVFIMKLTSNQHREKKTLMVRAVGYIISTCICLNLSALEK